MASPDGAHHGSQEEPLAYLGLARTEGMEKNMETAIKGYMGTTIRIHSFVLG